MNTSLGLRLLLVCVVAVALIAVFNGRRSRKIPGLVPLEGTVTYEGIPLAWATLTFAPSSSDSGAKPAPSGTSQRVATAMTDADGRFVASVLGVKGANPGKYVVTVEKYIPNEDSAVENWEKFRQNPRAQEPKPEDEIFDVISAIPLKYSDKKTSELEITVEAKGSKDVVIELSK